MYLRLLNNPAYTQVAPSAQADGKTNHGRGIVKTRAAIAIEPRKPLEIVELDLRDPNPDEVLIRLDSTAVCHSDLAFMDGEQPMVAFPVVLGHEGAGVVEQVGDKVTSLAAGDRVILTVIPQCGKCSECLSGRSNLCVDMYRGFSSEGSPFSYQGGAVDRFMHTGAFTERTVVIESGVTKINDAAPLNRACLAACCVATGVGATIEAGQVRAGETVAVFGLGGVGLNAVQGARFAGASRIIAVDTNGQKESIARQFGATDFINPREIEGDVSSQIQALTGGGVDVAVEAIGHPETARQALRSARMGSGRCVVVGMMPSGSEIKLTSADLGIGRSIKISAGGDFKGRYGAAKLVDWYVEGKLDFDGLVTETFALEDINAAIASLRAGKAIRNIIDFNR